MKAVALLLGSFMILGVATGAVAQSTTTQQPSVSAPSAPSTAPGASATDHSAASSDRPAASSDRPAATDKRPDVNVNVDRKGDTRNDDGSALPRSAAGERTTIFGLSPTAAVVIAAALLVVVILAIVAMTRSGGETTTYIDRDRRL